MEKPHGKDAVIKAIIEAAIPLIADRGAKAVSFRDIAIAANVHHGLIVRHFGNKKELMRRVADYISVKLFQAARHRGEPLENAWSRVIRENQTEVRATARILIDTPSSGRDFTSTIGFMDEILEWLRSELKIDESDGESDPKIFVFMAACLLIGSEIFGAHIQKFLDMSEIAYQDLRPKAFQVLMHGFTELASRKNSGPK